MYPGILITLSRSCKTTLGILNYTVRLVALLKRYFHVITVYFSTRTFIGSILRVLKLIPHVKVIVFPHMKWFDVVLFVILYPLASITGRKVVIVLHDIHGFYSGTVQWKLLINIRSAKLTRLPQVIPIFNSVYTLVSVQKTFNVTLRSKAIVLYPLIGLRESDRDSKGDRFILCFSRISKILNRPYLEKLLRIFHEASSRRYVDKLVIAGAADNVTRERFERLLDTVINDLSLESIRQKIVYRFNVSFAEKEDLLKRAIAIFYLNTIEGLGLPVLEALEFLKPVYAPRRTALRELVPEEFNLDRNVNEIVYSLKTVVENGNVVMALLRKHVLKMRLFQLRNLLKLVHHII